MDLDTHIRKYRLGRPCLTVAFDHAKTGEGSGGDVGGGEAMEVLLNQQGSGSGSR